MIKNREQGYVSGNVALSIWKADNIKMCLQNKVWLNGKCVKGGKVANCRQIHFVSIWAYIFIYHICCSSSIATTYTLPAIEDTTIAIQHSSGAGGDWSSPADTIFQAGVDGAGYIYWGWLKFHIPALLPSEKISSAALYFVPTNLVVGSTPFDIGVYYCNDSNWSDQTLTYNTAPWSTVDSSPTGHAAPIIWEWNTLDVTSPLQGMRGGQDVTFVYSTMDQSVSGIYCMQSSESNYIPYVELQTVSLAGGFDLNGDGYIDFSDITIVAEYWLDNCSPDDWCGGTDFSYNGTVNFEDLALLACQWLQPKDYSVPGILKSLDVWLFPQPKKVNEVSGMFDLQNCDGIRFIGSVPYSDVSSILDRLKNSLAQRSGTMLSHESGYPSDGYILAGVFPDNNLPTDLHGVSANEFTALSEQGYVLNIDSHGVIVVAKYPEGLFNGVQTLIQIATDRKKLRGVHIVDWPSLKYRGVQQDISRGQVPKVTTFKRLIDVLAEAKGNVLEPYIENVYKFANYPDISPTEGLSPEDANEIFAHGVDNNIDVHPFFQVLGHSSGILNLPQYQDLRVSPCVDQPWMMTWDIRNPEAVSMMHDLVSEICQAFPGAYLNVDVTEVDIDGFLNTGSTQEEVTDLIFNYILGLNDVVKQHGMHLMIAQGPLDSVGSLSGMGPKIDAGVFPQDVMIGSYYCAGGVYQPAWQVDYPRFQSHGITFFTQPWIDSHIRILPWVSHAMNFSDMEITRGLMYGAKGSVTTDWGDAGHFHFVGQEWYPFVYHCASAWTGTQHDRDYFNQAFTRQFYGIADDSVAQAIKLAGNISDIKVLVNEGSGPTELETYYFWEFFQNPFTSNYIIRLVDPLNIGEKILQRTNEAVNLLETAYIKATRNQDNIEQLLFGAKCYQALGNKLIMVGHARNANYPRELLNSELDSLVNTYTGLKAEFQRLWLAEDSDNDGFATLTNNFNGTILGCLDKIGAYNFLSNASFELGDLTGWNTTWSSNSSVSTDYAHTGGFSAKLSGSVDGSIPTAYLAQYPTGGSWTVPILSENDTVKLGVWLLNPSLNPLKLGEMARLRVQMVGEVSGWYPSLYSDWLIDSNTAHDTWVKREMSFTVPQGDYGFLWVELDLDALSGGMIYADDFYANIYEPFSMTNAGFETGDFTGWNINGQWYPKNSTVSTNYFYNGTYSLKIDNPTGAYDPESGYAIQYPVGGDWGANTIASGDEIMLTAWVLNPSSDPLLQGQTGSLEVGVYGDNSGWSYMYSGVLIDSNLPHDTWIPISWGIIVPQGDYRLVETRITMNEAYAMDGGSIYADDFNLLRKLKK